jgi:hypothetical protein
VNDDDSVNNSTPGADLAGSKSVIGAICSRTKVAPWETALCSSGRSPEHPVTLANELKTFGRLINSLRRGRGASVVVVWDAREHS